MSAPDRVCTQLIGRARTLWVDGATIDYIVADTGLPPQAVRDAVRRIKSGALSGYPDRDEPNPRRALRVMRSAVSSALWSQHKGGTS